MSVQTQTPDFVLYLSLTNEFETLVKFNQSHVWKLSSRKSLHYKLRYTAQGKSGEILNLTFIMANPNPAICGH